MRLQTWPRKNLPLDLYLLPSVPHFCPSPCVLGPSLLTENPVRAFPKSLLRRVSRSRLPSLTLVVDCVSHHSFLFFFLVLYLTGLTGYKLLLSDTAWHWSVMVAHWCWRGAVVVLWGAQWLGDSAFHWGYRGEPPITSKHRFQMGEWGFTVNSICFPW